MEEPTTLFINTDGGSRGNPGPAGIGVYGVNNTGEVILEIGKTIGVNTNNVAEYMAVITALSWIIEHPKEMGAFEKIQFRMDSQLICSQINGIYKVKNETMQKLIAIVREKEKLISQKLLYTYVPREQNKDADRLVNFALDNSL